MFVVVLCAVVVVLFMLLQGSSGHKPSEPAKMSPEKRFWYVLLSNAKRK